MHGWLYVEKSMQQAALEAIAHLRAKAPAGFDDWFIDWESLWLTAGPPPLHCSDPMKALQRGLL
jgi:hypothetical protein